MLSEGCICGLSPGETVNFMTGDIDSGIDENDNKVKEMHIDIWN